MNPLRSQLAACGLVLALFGAAPLVLTGQNAAPKPEAPSRPAGSAASGRQEAARERQNALLKELALTDQQRDQLREAQKTQAAKLKALREDPSLTREQKAARSRELRDAFSTTTRSILTAEQYEKWQKSRETRRPRPAGAAQATPSEAAPAPAK